MRSVFEVVPLLAVLSSTSYVATTEQGLAAGFKSCSADQQSYAGPAIGEALTLATKAYANLATPSPNPTYSEWFGSSTPARLSTVKGHFGSLKAALTIGVLDLSCACTATAERNGVRAYAIYEHPYQVFLCKGFFGLHVDPAKGFDTRGGVLLHEVSHFTIVNDLLDTKPGVAAARKLAASNPDAAIRSAYNHAFFAEAVAGAH